MQPPETNGIYNILDTRYEFLLTDTQIVNETYENSTTRVAIVHQNVDDLYEEGYYAIAESK